MHLTAPQKVLGSSSHGRGPLAGHMRRRDFIAKIAASGVLAVLSPTYAETAERIWRMGVLTPVDDSFVRSVVLPHLASRGFVGGRNLVVDVRVGPAEQMPELAQALVGGNPDVIIANSDWALHPARAATSIIPIVAVMDVRAMPVLKPIRWCEISGLCITGSINLSYVNASPILR